MKYATSLARGILVALGTLAGTLLALGWILCEIHYELGSYSEVVGF